MELSNPRHLNWWCKSEQPGAAPSCPWRGLRSSKRARSWPYSHCPTTHPQASLPLTLPTSQKHFLPLSPRTMCWPGKSGTNLPGLELLSAGEGLCASLCQSLHLICCQKSALRHVSNNPRQTQGTCTDPMVHLDCVYSQISIDKALECTNHDVGKPIA